jgi:hypothetical protein
MFIASYTCLPLYMIHRDFFVKQCSVDALAHETNYVL